MKTTLIGLVRDFAAAVIGLLILFGVDLTDDQVAGLLLVLVTGGALGSYLYGKYTGAPTEDDTPA